MYVASATEKRPYDASRVIMINCEPSVRHFLWGETKSTAAILRGEHLFIIGSGNTVFRPNFPVAFIGNYFPILNFVARPTQAIKAVAMFFAVASHVVAVMRRIAYFAGVSPVMDFGFWIAAEFHILYRLISAAFFANHLIIVLRERTCVECVGVRL